MDSDEKEIPSFDAPFDPEAEARWDAYRALMHRAGAARTLPGLDPETEYPDSPEHRLDEVFQEPRRAAASDRALADDRHAAPAEIGNLALDRASPPRRAGTLFRLGAAMVVAAGAVFAASEISRPSSPQGSAANGAAPIVQATATSARTPGNAGAPPYATAPPPISLATPIPPLSPSSATVADDPRRENLHLSREHRETRRGQPRHSYRHPLMDRLAHASGKPNRGSRESLVAASRLRLHGPRAPVDQAQAYRRRRDAYLAERDAFDQTDSGYQADRSAYERQLAAYRRARAAYDAKYGRADNGR